LGVFAVKEASLDLTALNEDEGRNLVANSRSSQSHPKKVAKAGM
jgi:hypothetical protein